MAEENRRYEQAYDLLSPEEKRSFLLGKASSLREVINNLNATLSSKVVELDNCNKRYDDLKGELKQEKEDKKNSEKSAKKYLLISLGVLLCLSILLILLKNNPIWQAITCLVIITGTVGTAIYVGADLEGKFAGPAFLIAAGIVTVIGLGIYTPSEIGQKIFDKYFKSEENAIKPANAQNPEVRDSLNEPKN